MSNQIHKKYKVILIDPPWRYQNWTDKANGAAISHYNGMDFSSLKIIPIRDYTEDNCLLCLWATWPKLNEAIALIEYWKFKYITGIPWIKILPDKIRMGIGFWFRSCSEILLFATVGKLSNIQFQKTPNEYGLLIGEDKQFYSPIGKHSAKPLSIHDWIETQFNDPYMELFARNKRDNWDCYGDDLGYHISWQGIIFKGEINNATSSN